MNSKLFLLSLLLVPILVSTSSALDLLANVHSIGEAPKKKSTFSLSCPSSYATSQLQEKSYQKEIIAQLEKRGFIYSPEHADYKVFYKYGINDGKNVEINQPMIGQTGTSGSFTQGHYWGYGMYSASSYNTPSYGVVGMNHTNLTIFTRQLDISFLDEKGEQTQDVQVVSSGPSNSLTIVLPYMIQAAFKEYPLKDGQTKVFKLEALK